MDKDKMDDEWEHTLISLVNSENPTLIGEEKLCKDWFIKVEQTFGWIARQKGLFLFMGNHHHSNIKNKYIQKEK